MGVCIIVFEVRNDDDYYDMLIWHNMKQQSSTKIVKTQHSLVAFSIGCEISTTFNKCHSTSNNFMKSEDVSIDNNGQC